MAERIIDRYCYTPLNPWKTPVLEQQCRYSVHESGCSVGFVQCTRRPTTTLEGEPFCTQHARMIQQMEPALRD